ncbi:hypothetical protein V8C35DRAFT_328348 [Trichoderma chlorosporum]
MSDGKPTKATARGTSNSNDDNYFDLSVRSLPGPPFFLLAVAPPSSNPHEHPRSTPWERAMQDGAFTNSSSPADLPDRKRVDSLSAAAAKFGVDPPRPPPSPRKSNASSNVRFWKWRSRSAKSASEVDALQDGPYASRVISVPGSKARYEPPRHDLPSIHQVWTPYLSESDHVFSLQHPTAPPVSPSSVAITPSKSQQSSESIVISPGSKSHRLFDVPKIPSPENHTQTTMKAGSPTIPLVSPRVLYLKAKKEIESKLKQKQHEDSYIHIPADTGHQEEVGLETNRPCNDLAPDEDCRTQSTVEGVRRFLASQSISKTGTWFKDEFHTSKIGRKLFGKAPWHRKDSGDSFTSVSSSVRAVLKGKTPPASPIPHGSSYTSRFNLFHNTFPGGEAVRVSTPPLDEVTANGRPRAFFTSLTPPMRDGETSAKTASPSIRSAKRYSVQGSSMASQPREWWEQISQRGCRREIPGTTGTSASKFEFDVPEHLPASPMCPANKRHKSGGTGVCVYHGRRKTRSVLRDEMSRVEAPEYSSADNG